jgi:hypothetical protein
MRQSATEPTIARTIAVTRTFASRRVSLSATS